MDDFLNRVRNVFSARYKEDVKQQNFLEKEVGKPNSKLRLKDRGPGLEHVMVNLKDKYIPEFRIPLVKSDDKTENKKGREPGE